MSEYISHGWKKQLYCGVIETVPEVRGKTLQAEVRLSSVRSVEDTLPPRMLHHSILLYWVSDSLAAPLCCGDSVCFYGQVSRPSFKEAGFDYAVYLERKGISGTAVAFSAIGSVYLAAVDRHCASMQPLCNEKSVKFIAHGGCGEKSLL